MSKPTPEQLAEALAEAGRMREHDEDPHFIAKALLNHNYRIPLLEAVMEAAKHYLRSGNGPHEHTVLMKAIEKADAASRRPGEDPDEKIGL
ncbi:MAG: hypothetical protein EP312_09980 [Gammaproteobacteria bacterium]|nr:MAG: hypothetical protein EP312_09980 [Gammaproteobacteria bacterium]